MESFLEGDEPDSGKDKNLDFSRILDSSKPNARLYLQAKERLRGRLVETGIQRTMPHLAHKPVFSASNIIPKRVIQGYQFYEARKEQSSTKMQRNRIVTPSNMNELSSIMDTSMNQNTSKNTVRLPKLGASELKTPSMNQKRSKSVIRGGDNSAIRLKSENRYGNPDNSMLQQPIDRLLDESPVPHIEEHQRLNFSTYQNTSFAGNNTTTGEHKKRLSLVAKRNMSPGISIARGPSPGLAQSQNYGQRRELFTTVHSILNSNIPVKKADVSMEEYASKNVIDKLTGRNIPVTRVPVPPSGRRSLSIKSRNSFINEPGEAVAPLGSLLQGINLDTQEPAPAENQAQQISRLQDVDSFIYLIKEKQINPAEFIYLVKREDDHYNLKLADFVNIKENIYYTLSSNGVTRYEKGLPVEFIVLKDWLKERDQYNHIKQLRFFTQFRAWKTLKKWIKILRRNRKNQIISRLNESLYIANPIFQQLLVNHKGMCLEIERLRFVELLRLETAEIQSLEEFKLNQEKKRNYVIETLQDYSKNLHQNVRAGVKMILEKLRNHIVNEMANDEDQFNEELKELANETKSKPPGKNVFEALGFPEFLNYVHRSMLRHECTRFLRLAYLLDFMTVEAQGNMYLNSVRDFTKKLDDLFDSCDSDMNLTADARRQTLEPIFYIMVEIDTVEIDPSQVQTIEVDPEFKNIEDFDLMTYAQFEVRSIHSTVLYTL